MHRLSHGQYLNEGDTLVTSAKKNLILLWGQSNILGQDTTSNITNANGYDMPWTNVTLEQWLTSGTADPLPWIKQGVSGSLAPYATAPTANLGPELSLGRHLDLVVPNKWVISKWGISASGLAANWLPTSNFPTSPPASPNLFTQAVNDARAVAAANNATIRCLIWGQGETDAQDATNAANYATNLAAFTAAVRAAFGSTFPIVIARIPASSPETYNSTVYTAQTNYVAGDPHSALVNTDDLVPLITSFHFSANNLVTLGHRLATAALGLMGITDAYQSVGWTTDGDGVGFPLNATEWNNVIAAANATYGVGIGGGGPYLIPDLTVASGNAPDLLGGVGLTASGTNGTYQTSVAGFTRKGIGTTDAATFKLASTDTSLPDLSAEDMAVLSYVRLNADTGTFRNLTNMGLAAGVRMKAAMKSAGLPNIFDGNTNNASGTKKPSGAMRPMYAQHRVSNSTAAWGDDLEYLTITFDATVAGKGLEILGGANTAPNATTMYAAVFRGTAARWTQTQLRAVLKVLRWQVQW